MVPGRRPRVTEINNLRDGRTLNCSTRLLSFLPEQASKQTNAVPLTFLQKMLPRAISLKLCFLTSALSKNGAMPAAISKSSSMVPSGCL